MARNLYAELKIADDVLPRALERYMALISRGDNLTVERPGPFTLADARSYTASTIAMVNVPETRGDGFKPKIYVVAFAAGDGTGDQRHYTLNRVTFPESLQGLIMPEGVIPRRKDDVVMEAAFPLFSIFNGEVYDNAVCLNEIGGSEEGNKINLVTLARLGVSNPEDFNWLFDNRRLPPPKVQLTTGFSRSGFKFGSPHAIHYPCRDKTRLDLLQVVGFLGFSSSKSKLCRMVEEVAEIPYGLDRQL